MVSGLASGSVDCGFKSRSGQTKDYNIGIRCFSANLTVLRSENKACLARDQHNVSKWSDMSNHDMYSAQHWEKVR